MNRFNKLYRNGAVLLWLLLALCISCAVLSCDAKSKQTSSKGINPSELCRPFDVQWQIHSDSAASAILVAAKTEITYFDNGSMRQKTSLDGRLVSSDGAWQLQKDTLVMTFENRLPQKHHISRADQIGTFMVTGGQYPFKLVPKK